MSSSISNLAGPSQAERRYSDGLTSSDSLVANLPQSTTYSFWPFPGFRPFQNQEEQRSQHAIEIGTFGNLAWDPWFMELKDYETLDPTTLFDGSSCFDTGSISS